MDALVPLSPTVDPVDRFGPKGPVNTMGPSANNRFNASSNNRPSFNPGRFQNQNSDTTMAPILLGVGGGLLFISICLLAARLWSRMRPRTRLHSDDWTVIAATTLAIANYIITSAAVISGLGRRQRFVSFARRRTAMELIFIGQVVWYWSILLVKISVACLLLRVKRSSRPWRIGLYSLITLLVGATIVQTCFQFLQCRPFQVYWDPRENRKGRVECFDRSIINGNIVAFSSLQVATDLLYSFIPITFIRKLHLPRREKVFMCVLMGLGLFASCAAIIRTMTLQEFYNSRDLFRTNVSITLWATVEQQFATIAATLPTLKAFFERALVRIGSFFYDEGSETQVRGRLVQFGLLGEDDVVERPMARKPSTLDSPGTGARDRKVRDEFGDTMSDSRSEKDIEAAIPDLRSEKETEAAITDSKNEKETEDTISESRREKEIEDMFFRPPV
ncbi:hypothetical protein BU24DRAFT_404190 [Aaosphaeria arxii CBS 175.79]|uniref:Rhodopsin domain-containing protein n=1 Tax=Aaosphaeria arxii CBS 175.79 TaxID=1450172 RepID=A0A6A5Y6F0_9PLEO|nr:uncharacterized protein BU24DRAFT_404190 [Aaosphaeria arxii CBS 175.79]KAF2021145.1 hypothetical protein BU24DRAFT_404190 [Aaosphaeria arxii CBS 175.79]